MNKTVTIVEPAAGKANIFTFFSYLPLMGPLYLGTLLKKNGFDVHVYNENILRRNVSDQELAADFLLLTCLTPTVQRGYSIAKRYKKLNPNGKVLIGGPHVSFMQEEASKYADHVISGEGENIIVDLLKYGSNEKFVRGTPVEDLDTLPEIDWNLLVNNEKVKIYPIMTSRGCPFACNFCSVTEMFGRRYRAMSPDRVIHEVKMSRLKDIFFYDDNFTADTRRAHKIMEGIAPLEKIWTAQVRSDVSKDPALVEKMARAGCSRVYIGFESINTATLKNMKKSQTPKDIATAIETLHKNSIKVHGMFIYGSDSDEKTTIKETVDFVKNTRIDSVQYSVLTPFPGTELFERMETENRIIHKNWEHYDGLHVVFWPENFTPFNLQNLAMDSFKSFYSVAGAANEIINLFADSAIKNLSLLRNKGVAHTYSFKNALFKAGGGLILKKWNKLNRSYMKYLQDLSIAKTA